MLGFWVLCVLVVLGFLGVLGVLGVLALPIIPLRGRFWRKPVEADGTCNNKIAKKATQVTRGWLGSPLT